MICGKILNYNDDLSEAFAIRQVVFSKEQNIDPNIEFDDDDKIALHGLVYLSLNEKVPVATGRIVYDGDQCKIGRVAVLKEYRGKRYGDFLVRMLLNRAFSSGVELVYCHAQVSTVAFYEKIGFKIVGEEFIEAGIRHLKMEIKNDEMIFNCTNDK